MEVAAKELNDKGKESAPETDITEDADKCNHFTIRGYVADVRKRDSKICWPLFMSNNGSSEISTNILPPLHVSNFRRWSCLNCLHTICSSAVVTEKADITNVQKEEIKTNKSMFLINVNAKRVYSGCKQSEDGLHVDQLASDSSINASHCGHNPTQCPQKKENESATEDVAVEGIGIFLRPNGSASAMNEGKEFQAGESQIRNAAVTENTPETVPPHHDTSQIVCASPNEVPTNGASDGVQTFKATNSVTYGVKVGEGITVRKALKDDTLNLTAANITTYDLAGLDQSNNEVSYSNMDLLDSMDCSQNLNSMISSSYDKMNHKRARKLRLLDDIMKSEELHISKKAGTSRGVSKLCQTKSNHDRGSDGSKCEDQIGDPKSNLDGKNSKSAPIYHANGMEIGQTQDEELSLMHWLKKVSKKNDPPKKKGFVGKRYVEFKHIEDKFGVSSSSQYVRDGHPLAKVSRVCKHKKNNPEEMNNELPHAKPSALCLMRQQGNLMSRDATVKLARPENVYSKMRKIVSLPGNLGKSSGQKHNSIRRKKKASQVEDGHSWQIHWEKMQKEVTKKQRTTKTHEKESLDDIPMDIVELLAKSKHEKRLMNAEVVNERENGLPMLDGVKRCINDSNASGYLGRKVPNMHAPSNDTGYDIPTASHGKQNANNRPEVCKSARYQKHILIDLNQQAADFLTIPECGGHKSCATHSPVTDFEKGHYHQDSWCSVQMQDLGSHQQHQGNPAPSTSGGSHDILSRQLNGRIVCANTRNVDTYCNHVKMVPYDSFRERSWRTIVQDTNCQEPIDLPTQSYLMEGGNRLHSGRASPTELRTDETISAMHLLRLVDQAALSSSSWELNHAGWTQDSNRNFMNRGTTENSLAAGYGQSGNFSKPHRPIPRIGALGSLLQKEIMAPLSSKAWSSDEIPLFCTDGVGEASNSHLSRNTSSNKNNLKAGDSLVHKVEMSQVGICKKDDAVRSGRHDCVTINCVVNRNPADFSLPVEDNVYMRGVEEHSSKVRFSTKGCGVDCIMMGRSGRL